MGKEQAQGIWSRDLAYIRDPMQWVMLLCPVKRYVGNRLETAYLTGDGPNLYMGNMWNPSKDDPKTEFGSFEAIVDADWVVD